MRKARHRAKLSVKGRFSKKPGLVSTMGRTKFIRAAINNRASCNDGCREEIPGTFVGTWTNASPIEIPLTFSKPIVVDWDDEIDPIPETIKPGERVIHNYLLADGVTDAGSRARTIKITFLLEAHVKLDYSEEAGSYFATHTANGKIAGDTRYPAGSSAADRITVAKKRLNTITSWGKKEKGDKKRPVVTLRSLEGAENLTGISAKNAPKVTASLKDAFKDNKNLIQVDSINDWNTENVTDMQNMFEGAAKFTGGVAGKFDLNTRNVKTMKNMFKGAAVFNAEFGDKFKTNNVETMQGMFFNASAFNNNNKPIKFETPKLGTNGKQNTAAQSMFENATAFTQDVSELDFRNVANLANAYNGSGIAAANAKKAKLGEKKASAKDGILKVESKTPFYFKTVGAGLFATGYVDQSLYGLDKDKKAMKGMTGAELFASINKPGDVVNDEYKMINYKNNRILGIEVRHANTTDTPVSQEALSADNVYIYFSKPVTLTSVKIAQGNGNTLTTHTAVANTLHKVSTVANATDNAATPAVFPQKEKDLLIKGIGKTRPAPKTVYRLTGVNGLLFGDGLVGTAYPGATKTQGIRVILE